MDNFDPSELNEPNVYRLPPNNSDIKGLNLHIDEYTQKLCETYNTSSGTTRSVLYVLMIINVIAVIAVFNSNIKYNWEKERILECHRNINKYRQKLAGLNNISIAARNELFKQDSVMLTTLSEFYTKQETALTQTYINDYEVVKVNIIGVSFDIYDMPSIVGLSIIVLMIVLRFTLIREMNNLRIAFNSITERYPDDADFKIFEEYLPPTKIEEPIRPKNKELNPVLTDINFVRRRYHYNFLSMNEVFNVPYLDTSKNKIQKKILGSAINKHLFYFSLIVYSYVMFNFFCNLPQIIKLKGSHTAIILVICVVCYVYMALLCRACTNQKNTIVTIFENFWTNSYKYNRYKRDHNEYPVYILVIASLVMLAGVYGLGWLFDRYL